tara:strand:+ start:2492 stop:2650 length:159 start_codon:yes stop_codon:yes gene_type:complete
MKVLKHIATGTIYPWHSAIASDNTYEEIELPEKIIQKKEPRKKVKRNGTKSK